MALRLGSAPEWLGLEAQPGTGSDSLLGMQECSTSGRLWAEAISVAPRPARKQKGAEALKRCNDDPHVVAAIAQLFQVG